MRPDQFSQMMKYLTRPSMARGGRIGFADGLSFMEFGEEQTGSTAQNLRRQLSPGQKNKIVPKSPIAQPNKHQAVFLALLFQVCLHDQ